MASNKSILQRIEEVEVQVHGLRNIATAIQNVQSAGRSTLAIVDALIREVGDLLLGDGGGQKLDQKIHERLLESQRQAIKQQQLEQKKILDGLVASGQMISSPNVTSGSVLILNEYQVSVVKEGDKEVENLALTQEQVQVHISALHPELAKKLEGQPLGASVRDGDFDVKIVGIYDVKAPGQETQLPALSEPVDPVPVTDPTPSEFDPSLPTPRDNS